MGIKATVAYHGVAVPGIYWRIKWIHLEALTYTAMIWGWKDRPTSLLDSDALSPAFTMTTTTPYVLGADPFLRIYLALKQDATLSAITDVLES